MTEDEIKDAIASAVADATKGLKATITELKGEKTDLKNKLDAATTEKDEIAATVADKSGDVEALKASHATQIAKLNKTIEGANAKLESVLIDGEISKAIAEAGVPPHFVKAVTVMLKQGAKLENGMALGADGEPINEYAKGFLSGDEGRHFVSAPINSGAGASGSTAKSSEWTKPPETADEINKWMKYTIDNPGGANSLSDKWNMPALRAV